MSSSAIGIVRNAYVFLVISYAALFLIWFEAFRTVESLLIVGFVALLIAGATTFSDALTPIRDPFFRACIVLAIFLIVAGAWHALTLPEGYSASSKVARHYLKPMLVVPLAVGLVLYLPQGRWYFLLAAVLGLTGYLVFSTSAAEWQAAWAGRRVDFGIRNAQHTAMFFGVLTLGLMIFAPRLILSYRGWRRVVIVAAWAMFMALAVFGVVVTQTRAIWLGMLVAMLALLACLVARVASQRGDRKSPKLFIGLAIVLGVGIALPFGDRIWSTLENRLSAETVSLQSLTDAVTLSVEPTSSTAVRVASWRLALDWVSERPVLGWGAGSAKQLITDSDKLSPWFKARFGHLHSSYMEALLAYGLVGFLLIAFVLVVLARRVYLAYSNGAMPFDVFVFACAFFAFWLVINKFESYILYSTGQYIFAVALGFVYSFCLGLEEKKR